MIAEIGLYCLILALFCSAVQMAVGLFVTSTFSNVLTLRAAYLQFAFLSVAFGALIILFVSSDLSVLNVIQNSHTQKPFLYKITASWASHEGSMLLWCWMIALFGLIIATQQKLQTHVRICTLGVQGALGVGFMSFLIFTSNPFGRVLLAPFDGQDLNPILQDPSLAIHPPMLFLGYVGFSAQFSLACAVLLKPHSMDIQWAKCARKMTLIAWFCLTAGLCLGSYWAYYELGWGGWWFWDPVENVALMPWLTGTALLHTLRVHILRGSLAKWTILLSILTFALSVLGTFLVRSGLLTSVHSFAVDPGRGLFLLGLALIYVGGGLALYSMRAKQFTRPLDFGIVSRESVLVMNNLLLLTIMLTVFIGTAYPIILPLLTGSEISVGASYFNHVLLPLAVPMLVLMGGGISLKWRHTDMTHLKTMAIKGIAPVILSILNGALVLFIYKDAPFSAAFWVCLGTWLILGVCQYIKSPLSFFSLTRDQKAMTVAHFGVGVAILGMVGSGILMTEREVKIKQGEHFSIGSYTIKMHDVKPVIGPNYLATRAIFEVTKSQSGDFVTFLEPERRTYSIAGTKTTETAIRTGLINTLYVALGESGMTTSQDPKDPNVSQSSMPVWIVRAQIHPFMSALWFGMGLVVLSALFHIRRHKAA